MLHTLKAKILKPLSICFASVTLCTMSLSASANSSLNIIPVSKPSSLSVYHALLNAPTGAETIEKERIASAEKAVAQKESSLIVHQFISTPVSPPRKQQLSLTIHKLLQKKCTKSSPNSSINLAQNITNSSLLVDEEFAQRNALSESSILTQPEILIVYSSPTRGELHLANLHHPSKPMFTLASISDEGVKIVSTATDTDALNKMASNEQPFAETHENPFQELAVVSNDILKETRGAFITSSGLIVDFGLITQTIVDSEVINQSEIIGNTDAIKALNAKDLQQLITVTGDEVSVQGISSDSLPAILTVIQNSANDKVIQNLTTLNLDVSNLRAFKNQALTPILNNQSVFAQ